MGLLSNTVQCCSKLFYFEEPKARAQYWQKLLPSFSLGMGCIELTVDLSGESNWLHLFELVTDLGPDDLKKKSYDFHGEYLTKNKVYNL